jgi:superfamily II DNA or RNA helicase
MKQEEIQNSILETLSLSPNGRLILSPRFGKTRLILKILKRLNKNVSILWVTPFNVLKPQIIKEFKDFDFGNLVIDLQISTWSSLDKTYGNYDFIILDEEQYITEKNSKNLLDNTLSSTCILSMTGTATKKKEKIDIYKKLNLNILADFSISQAVDQGVLSDYEIRVLNIQYDRQNFFMNKLQQSLNPIGAYEVLDNKIVFTGKKEGCLALANLSESKNGTMLHKVFNKDSMCCGYLMEDLKTGKVTIQGIDYYLKNYNYYSSNVNVLSLFNQIKDYHQKIRAAKSVLSIIDGKALVFSASIKQAEKLCENTYHSKSTDNKLEDFINDKIDRLSLVNLGSVGSNFLNLKHLLLVQCDSDRNGKSTQKITRILLKEKDKKPIIWLFCLKGTQDEKWVENTLQSFDKNKIKYIDL